MTPELQALARRAVACKGWRWMPGMLIVDAHGVRGYVVDIAPLPDPGAWVANRAGVAWLSAEEMGRCLPDLSHPATPPCLLALVREAWDDPHAHAAATFEGPTCTGWRVWLSRNLSLWFEGSTEAEALVVALERAP